MTLTPVNDPLLAQEYPIGPMNPREYLGDPRGSLSEFPAAPLDPRDSPRYSQETPGYTMSPEGSEMIGIPGGLTPWMIMIVILATRLKPIFQALASGVTDSQMSGKEFTKFLKEEFEAARIERQEFLKSLNEVVTGFEAEREALLRSLDTLEEFVRSQAIRDLTDSPEALKVLSKSPHKRPQRSPKSYGPRKIHPDRPNRDQPPSGDPRES